MPSAKLAEKSRLDALREEIAEAVAGVKAYNVPALCVRLGLLTEATEEDQTEAFRSKRGYVRPMLRELGEADLLRIAERTLEEVDHPPLELVVTEMTKHSDRRVSVLVRKDVLAALHAAGPLFGDQPILDTLERIFGSQAVVGERLEPYFNRRGGPITQWYIRNDDWSHQQMLEHCGALDCPQATFFKLLEAVLHPLARRDKEQTQLAASISDCLRRDGFVMQATSSQSGYPIFEVVRAAPGVDGSMKNLIFASIGPKPELIIRDAVNNDVEITKNADKVLVFDRAIAGMLTWGDLQGWWADKHGISDGAAAKKSLYERLLQSVKQAQSPGELAIYRAYYAHFGPRLQDRLPVLVPQVYLHYDPYTRRERGQEQILVRQRMDFLLLLDNGVRVVVEVDGQHHYAIEVDGKYQAHPGLYAAMAAEDRRLRLAGYEVYRFGGHEFTGLTGRTLEVRSTQLVADFFERLFRRHSVAS
jgi:very-short-patch-repair endonuclease